MNRRLFLGAALSALGGGLIGSPTWRVMAGEVPGPQPSSEVMTTSQRRMVATLAELIIPATDTPGAVEAGVPAFIEMMVSDWYTNTERQLFFAGLAELDGHCQAAVGRSFQAAGEPAQVEALAAAETSAKAYRSPAAGLLAGFGNKQVDEHTPFFAKIKELTLIGYFHSELGATRELAYEPMPMHYDGDYDYAATGRQWSH